ncbi:NTP transferase domain-containing protein [Geochorda subterranea]|uniref:NTP transferase domain-containing protein n=1 Tax=Geochorda subterranea TaxID=3109564 RepID=A0ABZ1BPG4_9FIRM|nr:NTP transferase domain-containing protein [Limnochorda sp. LNt]WRP14711.1 NTP transferase domain-containing protein [Limnochorda sp. LNt]
MTERCEPSAVVLPPKLDVVLLAAAGNEGQLRGASAEPWEALIPIAGRPMVAYVTAALAESTRSGRIVCVGPPAVVEAAAAAAPGRVTGVAPAGHLLGNLERGLASAAGDYVMVVTSDIPLLKPHMVDDFVRRCEQGGEAVDVWYAVVERSAGERAYPGVRRTWVRLQDGTFTGGNLLVVSRDIVARTRRLLGPTLEGRKSPLTLARLLGPVALLRFMVGRLSIADVERRVGAMLGIRGRAVATPYVEIGIDVDKPDDLALAKRFLAPTHAGA